MTLTMQSANPPPISERNRRPSRSWHAGRSLGAAQWGMLTFLASEVAFFSTLIVTYLTFWPAAIGWPDTRTTALSLPLVMATTLCLLASSVTIHLAGQARGGSVDVLLWWGSTIVLGISFLLGTAYEWQRFDRASSI